MESLAKEKNLKVGVAGIIADDTGATRSTG